MSKPREIDNWMYIVTMADGSKWAIPVEVIARHRAAEYVDEFDGDLERSLNEDTLPLFQADAYEIRDWAANNMNWADVELDARRVREPTPAPEDYQEGWMNGEYEISDE